MSRGATGGDVEAEGVAFRLLYEAAEAEARRMISTHLYDAEAPA